ncbi:hypothetical protein, partial [Komagataeibacter oboediens]|uniref:hypothetical protein n=1 Tax=Komagataeibacter oboediens TaxID=65958 RepID=UPI001C645D81
CVLNRMDIDRLDPHAHTTDSKALSSLKNFRIGLSDSQSIPCRRKPAGKTSHYSRDGETRSSPNNRQKPWLNGFNYLRGHRIVYDLAKVGSILPSGLADPTVPSDDPIVLRPGESLH